MAEQDQVEHEAWATALKVALGQDKSNRLISPFDGYRDDPNRFGREVLGHRYWAAQDAFGDALVKHKKVVVRSCRKSGKTYKAADTVLAFMQSAPTIAVTTAPSVRQIRELLWARIRSAHKRARTKLMGICNVQSLRIDEDWFALGIATKDPENVLGFHGGVKPPDDIEEVAPIVGETSFDKLIRAQMDHPMHRLLLGFDEAPGIEKPIFEALEGSMSGENVFAFMQGNPMLSHEDEHPYAQAFRDGSGWHRIHIGAEEPKEDPVKSEECFHTVPDWLLTKKWVDEKRQQWGEASPLFQAYVLGVFTSTMMDKQVIPLWVLEAAARYEIFDDERASSRHIGIDVSATETKSNDWCVATLWACGSLAAVHRWKSDDTMRTVGVIEALSVAWGTPSAAIPASNIHIDASGVGKGVVDRLRQKGLYVDGIDFGSKAKYCNKSLTGEMRFRDYKTELYWTLRRALQEGTAAIPRRYVDIWKQLQWHTHETIYRSSGSHIGITESKKLLREKYGRSPDEADAAVVAWSRTGSRPTFALVGSGTLIRG